MKKVNLFNLMGMMLLMVAVALVSCTKEGPAGKDGANGQDGIDGTDGTATCIQCHDNSQIMMAKIMQWESSTHLTGGHQYENAPNCAPCHTSQGFLERMETGTQTTAETIMDPVPPNCYTCHEIHATYTPADWALTYTEPVEYWFNPNGDATPDFGTGNLCANCHQSRISNPFPTVGSGDNFTVTSFRYGPHYGPMSQMLGGFGAYELPGSLTYQNSPHSTVENGCITCHMGVFNPEEMVGGHNMKANIVDNCLSCHPDGIEAETEEMHVEIDALVVQLLAKLVEKGIATEAGYLAGDNGGNASASNPANLTANELGAFYNYKFVYGDKSYGVHNYKYAKALLTNSIEALN